MRPRPHRPIQNTKSLTRCFSRAEFLSVRQIDHKTTLMPFCVDQETWLPVIKAIYELTSQPTSTVHVRSAWVVEQPNHGDAGVLNQKELKEHYPKTCVYLRLGTESLVT